MELKWNLNLSYAFLSACEFDFTSLAMVTSTLRRLPHWPWLALVRRAKAIVKTIGSRFGPFKRSLFFQLMLKPAQAVRAQTR